MFFVYEYRILRIFFSVRTGSFVYDVDLGMEWTPTTVRIS